MGEETFIPAIPKVALKPCPFCGCEVRWRRYMQVQHPTNDCWLSDMGFSDDMAFASGNETDHRWNVRRG